jgi:hypothetical protein
MITSRGGVSSALGLGPTVTARGQSFVIWIGMFGKLIMTTWGLKRGDPSTVTAEVAAPLATLKRLRVTPRKLQDTCLDRRKDAVTLVNLIDQYDWINRIEPCKQYLSMKVINGIETSWRRPTFVQYRWFTFVICDYDPCLCTPQFAVSRVVQQYRVDLVRRMSSQFWQRWQMTLDLLISQ